MEAGITFERRDNQNKRKSSQIIFKRYDECIGDFFFRWSEFRFHSPALFCICLSGWFSQFSIEGDGFNFFFKKKKARDIHPHNMILAGTGAGGMECFCVLWVWPENEIMHVF